MENVKIEIIEDLNRRGHFMFFVDAGIIEQSEVKDLINDIKMTIELRRKGQNND